MNSSFTWWIDGYPEAILNPQQMNQCLSGGAVGRELILSSGLKASLPLTEALAVEGRRSRSARAVHGSEGDTLGSTSGA